MGWVRLDDAFLDHPKFLQAGPLAGYLMISSIAWSNHHLRDGFIPEQQVSRLVNFDGCHAVTCEDSYAEDMAAELVEIGLWKKVKGGYRIHDYHDYQMSAEKIREKASQGRARQDRFRKRNDNAPANGAGNAPVTPTVTPLPTRA